MESGRFRVVLSADAANFLNGCSKFVRKRIVEAIELMRADPYHEDYCKKLVGPLRGSYRWAVGDYRIIYKVQENVITIYVLDINHRKIIYDH